MSKDEVLAIVFGLPVLFVSGWFWLGKIEKIKPLWVGGAIIYVIIYFCIFHFWLTAF